MEFKQRTKLPRAGLKPQFSLCSQNQEVKLLSVLNKSMQYKIVNPLKKEEKT